MAEEDEIDIVGDFSFNSCFAQNNQGIPSCSDREDTVHPQWFLDSTATNWYDTKNKDNSGYKEALSRLPKSNKQHLLKANHTCWTSEEKKTLLNEMKKYGRDVKKISVAIKTKTEAEIQAFIEAEYGVQLEVQTFGLEKIHEGLDGIPVVAQEEIVTDHDTSSINNVIELISTGTPTIVVPKDKNFCMNNNQAKNNSLLKPEVILDLRKTGPKQENSIINKKILYGGMMVGPTESASQIESGALDLSKKSPKNSSVLKPIVKRIGNHRRKISGNYDKANIKPQNKSKDNAKVLQNRQRKDSGLSEDNSKSPKLQIVLGSGLALPISEGEQVIKIEKKTDSDSESDIDIDVDSDSDTITSLVNENETPAISLQKDSKTLSSKKTGLVPKRQKKMNIDGEGGYTIKHTEGGDWSVEFSGEPKKERAPRRHQVALLQCRLYNADRPAPFEVRLHMSALIAMEAQAHTSRGEVMGLLGGATGGEEGGRWLELCAYRAALAASSRTHCDMDPVSQAQASEFLQERGLMVAGWHHSHPAFPPAPSALDLRTQAALQNALERPNAPFIGLITSQHWPTGRTASQYRCIRVEKDEDGSDIGYQFSVKLVPDLTPESLPGLLCELHEVSRLEYSEFSVDVANDVCPQAGVTYLEKCISSISHHLRSAGYSEDDTVFKRLIQGLRDIFR